MSNCTSGCPFQDCPSYGACLRGKGVKVAYCNSAGGMDATKQKAWDAELDLYRSATAQGIQPSSTKTADIERALEISNLSGTAFKADA